VFGMKSENDLKQFYDFTLSRSLKDLEEKRRKIASKLIMFWIVLGSVFLFGLLASAITMNPVIAIVLFIFLLIIGLIVFFIFFLRKIKSFTLEFKEKIVGEIVRFVDKNLSYAPEKGIGQQTYMDSQIFLTRPDRYKCEDYVSGKIGETQIEFSEIHSEYKTEHTDSKGHRQTQWHTIFRGLFFIADFNKNFQGTTVVLPDLAEKTFGFIGKIFQSWNLTRKGQLIKLEDPEFEKLFVVYGDDQITARYILTPGLMQRLVKFRESLHNTIFLSFKDSKVYIAISINRNLFEPRIFRSNEDFGLIEDYFENLELAVQIIEELGLNTRIWK
jgi:ABC-type multidrug transport system fused ATPase/permease subunit